ncbi:NDP-hexose 2,3-dehydratase family protein [Streptomyces cylindrosporus]|uniref:NDP-hexose 2,3-dehydratase family protein n=1 Tax=Streptomyces cylindrosporus TaxID=2927583 RepID=A0ABS9YCT5_9ACTN|nr:NDP-hexose 2,3-dehydratase family protein [Streptomyces cylindrosporus]MCI3275042.1 NDP-hexose 2,3-dehydratase family protein [Streptomyces cylindrosporus]
MTRDHPLTTRGPEPAARFTESGSVADADAAAKESLDWLIARRDAHRFEVTRVPFAELGDWSVQPGTGNLTHRSGKFFTVEGLRVHADAGPVGTWDQPIIVQPEIGLLGFVVKEIDGVLHCLTQAKMEPGNPNLVQVSPTVQATRSNFTRVHRGSATRYLEYFTDPGRARVLVDVLQSEQGSWFLGKRNRNIVVEVPPDEDVPAHPDFRWMTVAELRELLHRDNTVNMDARTVLSCIPFARPTSAPRPGPGQEFRTALRRSMTAAEGALHPLPEVLSWFTERTARHELRTERIPLARVEGWHRDAWEVRHEQGRHFTVFGARVSAASREVSGWTQPLLAPCGTGIAALLVKNLGGVLHALVHARPEAGHVRGVELAPTVQCTPDNYRSLPAASRPRFLDVVLDAPAGRVRFDAIQSEEGGRFHHAECRYTIIEAGDDFPVAVPEDYRWLTLHQLASLLQHSHYLNVQARSLVACLHCLW